MSKVHVPLGASVRPLQLSFERAKVPPPSKVSGTSSCLEAPLPPFVTVNICEALATDPKS
jgi:hypothetical protein